MSDDTLPTDAEATGDQEPTTTERVAGWLEAERGVEIGEAGEIRIAGDPPIALAMTVEDELLRFGYERYEAGAGATRADEVISALPDRGTTLEAAAVVDRGGVTITLGNHVYVDGLNRQSTVAALNEIVAAVDKLGARVDGAAETRVHEPVVAATDTDPSAAAVSQPTWMASHRVPSGGMRAWSEPDPSQQPAAKLEAGVELSIDEQRGDWAKVVGSNGWTGWVDARRLVAMAGAAPSAGVSMAGLELRVLPLVGGIALIASAFLPWVSRGGSTNSMDIPLSFLWDFTSSGDPQLGWVIVVIGVLTLALAVMPGRTTGALIGLGVVSVIVAGAFVVQMYRGVSDLGQGTLFDWLGIAPWVALGAGVITLAGAATKT